MSAVEKRARRGESLRDLVKEEIRDIFAGVEKPIAVNGHPKVTLIVGVNGTGKTTTVGKLANLLKHEGGQPLICAADTFSRGGRRAAPESGPHAPASTWYAHARAPILPPSYSMRSRRERPKAAIRSWSTPPADYTRGLT